MHKNLGCPELKLEEDSRSAQSDFVSAHSINRPGSVFTDHSHKHSLSFSRQEFLSLNVTQSLIG